MNHLLSLADLGQEVFHHLIEASCAFARSDECGTVLAGRSIGLDFRKTSTRTRTSFAAAAARLGAFPIIFGRGDLQTNTGESDQDTAAVLGGYLDALVMRTAGDPAELRRMADVNRIPIVNAMTADEHPTQALSDLAFMQLHFKRLSGLRLVYVGEGNNTAAALALGVARIAGMRMTAVCPASYGLAPATVAKVAELSARYGGAVTLVTDDAGLSNAGAEFDVVYTTRWQTTGTSKSDPAWRERFAPFRVSTSLMKRLSRDERTIFMHDLPAVRGEDCDAAVLDGPASVAFAQARQKLFTAMAVLRWCAQGQ